jgi:hypothetical protein
MVSETLRRGEGTSVSLDDRGDSPWHSFNRSAAAGSRVRTDTEVLGPGYYPDRCRRPSFDARSRHSCLLVHRSPSRSYEGAARYTQFINKSLCLWERLGEGLSICRDLDPHPRVSRACLSQSEREFARIFDSFVQSPWWPLLCSSSARYARSGGIHYASEQQQRVR